MRDMLSLADQLPVTLGRKLTPITAAQEAAELRDLSLLVFEQLPHNLRGEPMFAMPGRHPELSFEFVLLDL